MTLIDHHLELTSNIVLGPRYHKIAIMQSCPSIARPKCITLDHSIFALH